MFIAMNVKKEMRMYLLMAASPLMRMYLLMAASPLMRMAWCSASSTALMIGAPGPCGSCSCASSRSSLIQGIGMPCRLSFQGVHPVILSISPMTNLENWARSAGSSSGFLVPVCAGGAPPFAPLPLPGVLDPQCMVAHNLRPLKKTLRYKIVDWPIGQSSGVVGKWCFLLKMLAHLDFLWTEFMLKLIWAFALVSRVIPWSDSCDPWSSDEGPQFHG